MTSRKTLIVLAAAAGALALAACESSYGPAASAPDPDNSGLNAAAAHSTVRTTNPDASDPGGTRATVTGSGRDAVP